MREIKFRAWDKKEKRMYEWPFIIHFFDEEIRVHKEGYGYTRIPMDDIELLQFTGLKDRNGKEIYEGDIRCGKYYFDTEDQTRFQVMKWDKKSTCFYWDGPEIPRFIGVEVIGNIHENPELLQTNESTSQ